MTTDFYVTAPSSKFPIDHAGDRQAAEALRDRHLAVYPDAIIEPTAVFFERMRIATLASFPLSRVTPRFYEAMFTVLPPQYLRGAPGFFISEAVTQGVHAQFITHRGRFYAGYADLTRATRKLWSLDDVLALEARADATTPTLDWYPAD